MKIKRILLTMIILGYAFMLFSCSKVDYGEKDIFFESAIVTEFIYEGKKYVQTDENDEKNKFNYFFGYLINAEDLEKWQSYDQDDSLVYITISSNALYRADYSGRFKNRFEIYSIKNNADAFMIIHNHQIYRAEV